MKGLGGSNPPLSANESGCAAISVIHSSNKFLATYDEAEQGVERNTCQGS